VAVGPRATTARHVLILLRLVHICLRLVVIVRVVLVEAGLVQFEEAALPSPCRRECAL
jgi:hypothetical protein